LARSTRVSPLLSSGQPTSPRGKLSGQPYRKGATGAPILIDAPGAVECKVQGDHHIVVGEVVEAHLNRPPAGRPDTVILEMKDLGENVFYGG
jgi:flavin reductase (DIM6/NTAB) family NADH-FMN oxidoreductase RutF